MHPLLLPAMRPVVADLAAAEAAGLRTRAEAEATIELAMINRVLPGRDGTALTYRLVKPYTCPGSVVARTETVGHLANVTRR
jgi:hypothetical protein